MKTTKLMMIILALVIFFQLLSGLVVLYLTWPITSWTLEKASALGGSYGALSTLFSGLAFWGLIWTILLQRKEINRQRINAKLSKISSLLLNEARECINDLNLIEFRVESSQIFPTSKSFGQWQFFYYSNRLMGLLAEKEITTEVFFNELTSAVMSNLEQLTQFYERLDQSCAVARYMLADSDIAIEEIGEIKHLFFSTFSKNIFTLSEHMQTALQSVADKATKGKGLSLFHPLRSILTKIGSINQFEAQEVDDEFVKNWQRDLGKNNP